MTELFDSRCFFHMQRVQKRKRRDFDLENVEKFLNYRNEGTNDDGIARFSVFLPYATRQKRGKEGTNFDLENVEKSAKTFITICLVQDTPKGEIGSRFAIRFWQLLYRGNN